MTAHKPGFSLQTFLPYRVAVLAERLSRDLARLYTERFGISIPEWRVLACLLDGGDVTARQVTDVTPMDKVMVSRAVTSLVERGFVHRRRHPADARSLILTLTAEGQATASAIAETALAYEHDILKGWNVEDLAVLDRMIDRLSGGKG